MDIKDSGYTTKQPFADEDGITLYTSWDSEYFISWSALENPIECLLFIHHLCDKNWINRANIQGLIALSGAKFNWGYLGNKGEQ